jgi:FAD:protein FMN transferase
MGTQVRLLAAPGAPLGAAQAMIEELEARLTRFDPASELCRLNADPREEVPASPLLRAAIRAALAGAHLTGGLADPTLLGAVVRAGYRRSLVGRPRADLGEALAAAPDPQPATPHPAAAWRRVYVDDVAGTVSRPAGIELDLGGSAKGFAADRAVALLAPHGPCAADLGGDLRVQGEHTVQVIDPITGDVADTLVLRDSAVATTGIDRRIWWGPGGEPAHHLLDPLTGRSAWTGVIAATALAPSAALAEALAKAALLAGPEQGRAILARHGGVLFPALSLCASRAGSG